MGLYVALQAQQLADRVVEPGEALPSDWVDALDPVVVEKYIVAGAIDYRPADDEEYVGPRANVPYAQLGAPAEPDPAFNEALVVLQDAGLTGLRYNEILALATAEDTVEVSVEGDGSEGEAEEEYVGAPASAPSAPFTVADHSVREVLDYVYGLAPEEAAVEAERLLLEELDGQSRSSLVSKLEALVD